MDGSVTHNITPNSFGSFTDINGFGPEIDLEYVYLKKDEKDENDNDNGQSLPSVISQLVDQTVQNYENSLDSQLNSVIAQKKD